MYPVANKLKAERRVGQFQTLDGDGAKELSTSKPSIKIRIDGTSLTKNVRLSFNHRIADELVTADGTPLDKDEIAGKVVVVEEGVVVDEDGDSAKELVVTSLSSLLSFDAFSLLLTLGAAQITGAKITAENDNSVPQLGSEFFEAVTTPNGTVRQSVNTGVLKGQQLDNTKILGPFNFDGNLVIGQNRGLEYDFVAGSKVVVELFYDNLLTMSDMLGRILDTKSGAAN